MLEREDIKKNIGDMGATRRLRHAAAVLRFRRRRKPTSSPSIIKQEGLQMDVN